MRPSCRKRYAGISTCFRREAGAAGKDTRGIFRVHQFDKVEMFSFVLPEESEAEHERMLAIEEAILSALELPYRVVEIAVGDLGAPAARKFDCEAWIPSQGRYRELTSCSNTTDYQARRLGARYRPERRGVPRGAAHPQRHRDRGRANADRAARERPAGGRLGAAARSAGRGRRARRSSAPVVPSRPRSRFRTPWRTAPRWRRRRPRASRSRAAGPRRGCPRAGSRASRRPRSWPPSDRPR